MTDGSQHPAKTKKTNYPYCDQLNASTFKPIILAKLLNLSYISEFNFPYNYLSGRPLDS